MARGLNVVVNIGGRVNASLGSAATAAERRFGQMNRRLGVMAAETSAHMARTERRWGRFSRNANDFAWSVSAPMAGLSVMGGKAVYEWAKVGNELQAVTQMSDKARKGIEDVAKGQLGNPAENLKAALDLARSGFDSKMIAGALPTVLRMAKSDPSVDTEAAADIATNVIQGMRVPVEKFGEAADKLAFAASKSSTDIRLLGLSFKYAGPIAARMGSNMDEMSAAFMTMANAGIKGSESGVAMRSMFVRMVKPTKGSLAVLDNLELDLGQFVKGRRAGTGQDVANFLRADGVDLNKQSVANIDRIIASGLKGGGLYAAITEAVAGTLGSDSAIDRSTLSSSVIDAMTSQADSVDWVAFMNALRDKRASVAQINTIFDSRQGTRLMTLMSGDDLNRNLRLMKDGAPGWLMKMFQTSTKGIVGSWGRLQQSMGNLFIAMAESGVLDTVASAMNGLADGMMKMSKTNPAMLKALTWAILALAAGGPIAMALGGIVSGFRMIGGAIQFVAPLFLRLGIWLRGALLAGRLFAAVLLGDGIAAGLAAIATAAAPVVAVIAAIAVALAFVIAKWDGIQGFFRGFAAGFMKALGPDGMRGLSEFGRLIVSSLSPLLSMMKLLAPLFSIVGRWLGVIFAPAEVGKWTSWGMAAGNAVGAVVKGIQSLCDWLGKAIAKWGEFVAMATPGALGNRIGSALLSAVGQPPTVAGARARGGSWGGSRPYLVGERGPELAVPGRSGTIVPAHVLAAMRSGRGGGGGFTVGDIHIHGATDPTATAKAVRAELRKMARAQGAALND